MKRLALAGLFSASLFVCGMVSASAANASTSILVGKCIESAPCWTGSGPVSWSDNLSGAQLSALGLGTNTPFIAAQTAEYIMRIGLTTMTFATPGGPVVETVGEFSGNLHSDPCNFCEVDTLGTFFIPTDATSATISGAFGNSAFPSSSGGANLYLGGLPSVPEPATWAMLILGVAMIGFVARRRNEGAPLAA